MQKLEIIYLVEKAIPLLEKNLEDAKIGYSIVSNKGKIDISKGAKLFVCDFNASAYFPKLLADRLSLPLDTLFCEKGIPEGSIPLIYDNSVYGFIADDLGRLIIVIDRELGENAINSFALGNPIIDYLLPRVERVKAEENREAPHEEPEATPTPEAEAIEKPAAAEDVQKNDDLHPIDTTEKSLEEVLGEKHTHREYSYRDLFEELGEYQAPTNKESGISSDYSSGEGLIDDFVHRKTDTKISTKLSEEFTSDQAEQKKSGGKALKIILACLLALLVALGGIWVYDYVGSKSITAGEEYYKSLWEETEKSGKVYETLKAQNPDFVGTILLPQASYGYPVVAAKSDDTAYYEKHLFSGVRNELGTVYTKSEALSDDFSLAIIYGSGEGKKMLSPIGDYLKEDTFKKHTTVKFSSAEKVQEYAVFSAFTFKGDEPFLIERQKFLNDSLFNKYIKNLYDNSKIKYDVDANAGDSILVLVSKKGERTTVLATRRLRDGESADKLTPRGTLDIDEYKPQAEEDNEKEEDEEISVSIPESTLSPTTDKPTSKPVSKIEGNHLVQTGLTTNMDKTTIIKVENVVSMLNVMGMDKERAKYLVKNTLGLGVKLVGEQSTEKINIIIAQSVSEGAEISADNTVTLTYSTGIPNGKALVPDLIGGSSYTAESVLNNANLNLGKVTEVTSSREKGTILSQSVEPGEKITRSKKVNITVSDGKGEVKTVNMPSLIGKTKESAKSKLKKLGLSVGKITTVSSSKTAGTVISQGIPKNSKVEEGTTVSFTVSNGSKVNNLTVTNGSYAAVKVGSKYYSSGESFKGDYMDIIPLIVEAEMGSGFNKEALKAQAVAAYCWLINAGSQSGSAPSVPMKTASEKVKNACKEVYGEKAMYSGKVAQTYYYAINAGFTANCKDVWFEDIPYLRAVDSPGDKYADGFKTTKTYSASTLKSRVKSTYGVSLSGVSKSKWFKITHDENGAYVRQVNIGGKKTVGGSSFRDSLLEYELRSTAFTVKYNKSDDTFTFTVKGWGHGIGMSQVGANYYAKLGWSYSDILKHYYPGISIS